MEGCSPITDADLVRVLPFLLVATGADRLPAAPAVASYHNHLRAGAQRVVGWVVGAPTAPRAAFLAVCPPDNTALIMTAVPGSHGVDAAAQVELSVTGMRALAWQPVRYAQALLDPRDAARRALLERIGFRTLTELIYLERALTPIDQVEARSSIEWQSYGSATHVPFAQVVQASYEGSRDCPELAGLRPIDDVLAAHRAAGPFDPALWQLAVVDGDAAGCILLARVASSLCVEIVYLGVAAACRGRGIGTALVRRGIVLAARGGGTTLLVVVDARNAVARRLYARFGFRQLLRRVAMLHR